MPRRRFAGTGPADVRVYCPLDEAGLGLMRSAVSQLQLSARAFHRVLKLVPFGDY